MISGDWDLITPYVNISIILAIAKITRELRRRLYILQMFYDEDKRYIKMIIKLVTMFT